MPADRIVRIGDNKGCSYASDNFWAMGDTGPCGPCTGSSTTTAIIWGGLPVHRTGWRPLHPEIWNVVFIRFNRQADGTMEPAPSVRGYRHGSGAYLRHHAGSALQLMIDIFQALIKKAAEIVGTTDLEQQPVLARHRGPHPFLRLPGG